MQYCEMPVVDDGGLYITKVLVDMEIGCICVYKLQDGEHLLVAPLPSIDIIVKPHWTGVEWEETATPEEIAAWKAAQATSSM